MTLVNTSDESLPQGLIVADIGSVLEDKNSQAVKLFFPAIVYTAILMILGTVGNGLTLFVYLKYIIRPSAKRLFILVLALCDFISCSVLLPAMIAEIFYSYTFTAWRACKVMRFLFYYFPFASVLTLLLISVERYMKICHPLKQQVTLSLAKRLLLLVSILLPAIFAGPATILNGFSTIRTDASNITGVECHIADEFKRTPFPLVYNVFLLSVTFLSALVLIILYSLIWKTTWRHIRFDKVSHKSVSKQNSSVSVFANISAEVNTGMKKQTSSVPDQERFSCGRRHGNKLNEHSMKKVTHIMSAVTLVFIVSFIPNCVLQILNAVIPDFFNQLNFAEKIIYQLMLRSFMISYTANPLVYGLMDVAYRQACKDSFRCRKP